MQRPSQGHAIAFNFDSIGPLAPIQGSTSSPSPSSGVVFVSRLIRVRGTVQGVGFRPTVYRIANTYGVRGEVRNDGDGVLIIAIAPPLIIDQFLKAIQAECPPLAHITSIDQYDYPGDRKADAGRWRGGGTDC